MAPLAVPPWSAFDRHDPIATHEAWLAALQAQDRATARALHGDNNWPNSFKVRSYLEDLEWMQRGDYRLGALQSIKPYAMGQLTSGEVDIYTTWAFSKSAECFKVRLVHDGSGKYKIGFFGPLLQGIGCAEMFEGNPSDSGLTLLPQHELLAER